VQGTLASKSLVHLPLFALTVLLSLLAAHVAHGRLVEITEVVRVRGAERLQAGVTREGDGVGDRAFAAGLAVRCCQLCAYSLRG
jgi:hypothetical protein